MTRKYRTESFMCNPPRPAALYEILDDGKIKKAICYYKDTDYEQAKFIEYRMNNYEKLIQFVKSLNELYTPQDIQSILNDLGRAPCSHQVEVNIILKARQLLKEIGES